MHNAVTISRRCRRCRCIDRGRTAQRDPSLSNCTKDKERSGYLLLSKAARAVVRKLMLLRLLLAFMFLLRLLSPRRPALYLLLLLLLTPALLYGTDERRIERKRSIRPLFALNSFCKDLRHNIKPN